MKLHSKKIRCLVRAVLLLFLLSFSLSLFSCTEKGTDPSELEKVYLLENGFKLTNRELDYVVFSCGYRSENNVFDINDVSLTVFFGGHYDEDISIELQKHKYPYFSIVLTNEKGNEMTAKVINEELVSEKYRTEWTYSSDENCGTVIYKHSEIIAIPKHMFVSDKGKIIISLAHEYMYLGEIFVFYEKIGDSIRLSSEEIK